MSKYGNHIIELDGYRFDSKKEAARYQELALMRRAGMIDKLKIHPKFTLIPKLNDEQACTYSADFSYTENEKNIVEDVKSEATRKDKAYIIKRKLFKATYRDLVFREV